MESKSNHFREFPAHWDATLMGKAFWIDADNLTRMANRENNGESLHDINKDQTLHTKFPFYIGQEQRNRAAPVEPSVAESDEASKKKLRRFSVTDVMSALSTGRNNIPLTSSVLKPTNEKINSSSSCNASGILTRSSSLSSGFGRRSNHYLRTIRNLMHDLDIGETEAKPEMPPYHFTSDEATPTHPLMEFRGGDAWERLLPERRTLGIDIFQPAPEVAKGQDMIILPVHELAPLCIFRNLRSLKITGMVVSYQKYIWQAAWLNHNLDVLELGTALAPSLHRPYAGKWPFMKGGWIPSKANYGEPVYYGTGDGNLTPKVGVGEYLDKMAIEKAKICALATGHTTDRLSIRTLILNGFVVDADPFLHWFDTTRLRCINFKDNCVDAGFYLPRTIKEVTILFPKLVEEKPVLGRKVSVFKEVEIVQLKNGKKVGAIPFEGKASLKVVIPVQSKNGGESKDSKDKGKAKRVDGDGDGDMLEVEEGAVLIDSGVGTGTGANADPKGKGFLRNLLPW